MILAVNPLRATRFAQEAADAGVPSLVIPGGGVVEGGEAAATMQREVRDIAIRHGIALLGPNCMGMVDWTTNTTTYIGDVNPWLPRGHIAGLAQSGSVTDAFIHSPGTRIGYSRIVSVGAEVVLDLCDYLAYCLDDPETHAVMLFVEGFKRPERFLALADHALAIGKPILAVKVGRSVQAQAAAVAHSGSLAGEDRVTDAALDAAGVIRCDDLDELMEAAELIAGCGRLGRSVGGGRTGVVTVSTGEASLVADLAARTGLDLPPVPDDARAAILRDLPTMGYIGNPLDPWGADEAPPAYGASFEALAASGAYDVLAIVHDSPFRDLPSEVEVANDVSTALIRATAERPHILPVYVSLTSGDVSEDIKATLDAGRRHADAPRRARGVRGDRPARALGAAPGGTDRRRGHAATPRVGGAGGEPDAVGRRRHARSAGARGAGRRAPRPARTREPRAACRRGRPRDAGALRPRGRRRRRGGRGMARARRRCGRDQARRGRARAQDRGRRGAPRARGRGGDPGRGRRSCERQQQRHGIALRGLLVEPMAPAGIELIVGGRRDAVFGPAVLVGLGGILAEVLDDVAVLLAPVTVDEVVARLEALRGAALLRGVRGAPGVAMRPLAEVVVAIGDLLVADPSIVEIDCNPVIAGPVGAVAVDALVVVEDAGA